MARTSADFNKLLKTLSARRSVRRFLDKDVEDEKIKALERIFECLPSSMNARPWNVFIIRDREKIKELGRRLLAVHKYSAPVLNAPALAVVSVDENISKNHFVEDASICAFALWLALSSLGLGAVWIAVCLPDSEIREEIVREFLGLSKKDRVICLLPFGYPAEKPAKRAAAERKFLKVL